MSDAPAATAAAPTTTPASTPPAAQLYYRHRLPVRLMHWTNVIAFFVLLLSGLNIFNAHPALNWGESSYTESTQRGEPPLLAIGAYVAPDGKLMGVTQVLGSNFETTGVLGVSNGANGLPMQRGFPSWLTVPSFQWLGMARQWHFFFAWLLVINGAFYIGYGFISRHLSRDLLLKRGDLRSIPRSIVDHLRFRHPTGEAATRYNVLQKLSYLAVIFVLFPLIILFGWAMSPWLDTLVTGWVSWFGGRQSARTLHFIIAFLLVGFVFVHVFEVIISGFWNHIRSMITGRYRVPPTAPGALPPNLQESARDA